MEDLLPVMLKLLVAILCGGLIGVEREINDKPAGLRTNILICVGAAIFMILSMEMPSFAGAGIVADPGRIGAQIVTGIGFLGAGAIIQSRGSVHGLTTAATIWIVASIGMAVGIGMFAFSIMATTIILFVLVGLGHVERRIHEKLAATCSCTVVTVADPKVHRSIKKAFKDLDSEIADFKFIKMDENRYKISLHHKDRPRKCEELHRRMLALDDVLEWHKEN